METRNLELSPWLLLEMRPWCNLRIRKDPEQYEKFSNFVRDESLSQRSSWLTLTLHSSHPIWSLPDHPQLYEASPSVALGIHGGVQRGNRRRDVIKTLMFLTFAGRAATFWAIQNDTIVEYPSFRISSKIWRLSSNRQKTTCSQPLALQLGAGDEGLLLWKCHHSSWGIMWWKWCAGRNRSNVTGLDLPKAEKPYTRSTISTIFTSLDAPRCYWYLVHHYMQSLSFSCSVKQDLHGFMSLWQEPVIVYRHSKTCCFLVDP